MAELLRLFYEIRGIKKGPEGLVELESESTKAHNFYDYYHKFDYEVTLAYLTEEQIRTIGRGRLKKEETTRSPYYHIVSIINAEDTKYFIEELEVFLVHFNKPTFCRGPEGLCKIIEEFIPYRI